MRFAKLARIVPGFCEGVKVFRQVAESSELLCVVKVLNFLLFSQRNEHGSLAQCVGTSYILLDILKSFSYHKRSLVFIMSQKKLCVLPITEEALWKHGMFVHRNKAQVF